MRVTEHELDRFRAVELSPSAVLKLIGKYVYLLLRIAIGVGKSFAASDLMLHRRTYERFELVVYIAPTNAILDETVTRLESGGISVPWRRLEPRPRERCGDLDGPWLEHEKAASGALGRQELCETCLAFPSCEWPNRFKEMDGIRLILLVEAQLLINRSLLLLLKLLTRSRRVLVILDEARLLDANFELHVTHDDIRALIRAIEGARVKADDESWPAVRATWIAELQRILSMGTSALQQARLDLPSALHRHAADIQRFGWGQVGYRYVAYDLSQLAFARSHERWVEGGVVRCIARPYLHCHVVILSAHLTGAYAGHRLGTDPIASPFEQTIFEHTQTRIFNVRDPCGADKYFRGNTRRILDTFAVILLRNIAEGRSSVIVSRKRTRKAVADYLRQRLKGWGEDVTFLVDDHSALPETPSPTVVPVLHYGILGVNSYESYESLYCVNSYYVSDRVLNKQLREFEPASFVLDLAITSGSDRRRRVEVREHGSPNADRLWLANIYLRKLEVDPVIQVGGRVRFATKKREVVFFQMDDLGDEAPGCITVTSLVQLREQLGLPAAREIDEALEACRARNLIADGLTAEEAGARLGLSRRTVFRRLRGDESAKAHLRDFLMRSGTLAGLDALSGGQA